MRIVPVSTTLLSLSLLGAAPVPAAPVQIITLESYSYTPSLIRLRAGQPVTLTFVNRAGKGHDFTARKFFAAARILSGRVAGGEVDLGRGQSASVTLIPAAGRYHVHCGRPFHKTFGMKGEIRVQ